MNIIIIANAQTRGDALSGADRIFIECAKRWVKKGHKIEIVTCAEGYEMCRRYDLRGVKFFIVSPQHSMPLFLLYFLRMLNGVTSVPRMKIGAERVIVYSSSDFWPDSIPAWITKTRVKRIKWIAGFYLFAAKPFGKTSLYKGARGLKGLAYYFSQFPVYLIVRKFADMVWVTSEPDRRKFVSRRISPDNVIAVRGGVDVVASSLIPEPKTKKYDAVFIGRLHPQKGVLELIDIWNFVVQRKKGAMLAIIGVGDLEGEVRAKINKYGLSDNITMFGFKDGIEKLRIFKDSRVVVHPATYDSGGMAACEAMACGLPGVSFDLPALRTYYPKGMLKTPCYDLKAFAENILRLLNDENLYSKTSKDALDWAKEWDWDKRAEELLSVVQHLFTY